MFFEIQNAVNQFYNKMKKIALGLIFGICALISQNSFSQKATLNIIEDGKIKELVKIKSQLDRDNKIKEGYTIQLFYGERKDAESVISNYKKHYTEWQATIEYETPNYKVWVGNFITRLEADRTLLKIHNHFPNAFVFKPERKERN